MTYTLTDLFLKPTVKFYKRRIVKDPFHIAVQQWKRDRGDQSLRLDYPLNEHSTVLDVGGYRGDFAQAIHDRYGCSVMVFEPMPMFFELCKSRFANHPKVSVLGYGLGACDELLNLSDSEDASSFHRDDTESGTITAQVRDIESVWTDLGLTQVDLMKINIEGGEYPLLTRMIETGLASQVEYLQVQFHDFVDDAYPRRDAIRASLADTHDEAWCYTFVWENWKRKATASSNE